MSLLGHDAALGGDIQRLSFREIGKNGKLLKKRSSEMLGVELENIF